jgi:hypothetical protein
MLVSASFLSLLVPSNQIPGRMTLAITTTLTLVSMMNSEIDKMPKTAYLKALDIWMITCFTFTFMVLTEFCIVLALTVEGPECFRVEFNSFNSHKKGLGGHALKKAPKQRQIERAFMIETYSKFVLPLLFYSFTFVFFAVCYLHRQNTYPEGTIRSPVEDGTI